MKKLLLLSAFLVLVSSMNAQTTTVVSDVAHYYYNKHFYVRGGGPIGELPYTAGPAKNDLSHVGSKFECRGPITVTGLEAFTAFSSLRSSQITIPVHIYLCELDANGMPKLDPLDSVEVIIKQDTNTIKIGGNFPDGRTHVMTSDYAVLMRNVSKYSGDSIKLVRTSSATYTAWAAVNGPTWRDKYSDGNGFVRFNGKFYKTTNYNHKAFGAGTDYEFLVAPRITYTMEASQSVPPKVQNSENICTWDAVTFTNTSSWVYTNRMYNFIEFNTHWNTGNTPFYPWTAPATGFPTEKSITWFFRDQDNGLNYPDPRTTLPPGGGNNEVSHYSDSTGCFSDNMFIARLQQMDIGNSNLYASSEAFAMCLDYCGDDALGLTKDIIDNNIQLYPNPTSGKLFLSGIKNESSLYIYDLLGQLAQFENLSSVSGGINVEKLPAGQYLIKVVDGSRKANFAKVLKQD